MNLLLSAAPLLVATAAFLPVTKETPELEQASKPNILVIWGDDIGYDNISAYTSPIWYTPSK